MTNAETSMLIEELKKHKLCRLYWSEQISREVDKGITLAYEPVGDTGIYSRYFEFDLPYIGDGKKLVGTSAVIQIGISAKDNEYSIRKAVEGTDCYHNIRIKVFRDGAEILMCKFRLWDEMEEEYLGDQAALKQILNE